MRLLQLMEIYNNDNDDDDDDVDCTQNPCHLHDYNLKPLNDH